MCKYNNNLFVYVVLLASTIQAISSLPHKRFFDYYEDPADDYDLHYDQRQNGTDNYRVNFDGVLIAFPSDGFGNANNFLETIGDNLFESIPAQFSSSSYDGETSFNTEKPEDDINAAMTEAAEEKLSEKSSDPKGSKRTKATGRQRPRFRFVNLLNLLRGNYKHA